VVVGALAGFFGGWADALLARITDVFFAVPFVLAAIVVMQMFKGRSSILTVVLVLAVFGWPQIARITRGAVMSVKNEDFVTAARSLGSGRFAILARHVLPNAAAPIIVTATVQLGSFIVAEATLSFLGIGLPPTVVSWGADIAAAKDALRDNISVLWYPGGALALTVLGFIMMGDAVRDALDPKARK
jgi:peptide/nickel transport system permease protein